MSIADIEIYNAEAVRDLLDYPGCIAAIGEAMAALSASDTAQPLRSILPMAPGKLFGLMSGTLPPGADFGAKLVSVFADADHPGRTVHRGVIVAFDGLGGSVRCIADAGAVTEIRTACATAVATDALARPDARTLAVFGTGVQAAAHIRALRHVRPIETVLLWGRSPERTRDLAERMTIETGIAVTATTDGRAAAERADIICTVSAAAEPILRGAWVRPGTHVNLVGSSYFGPVEVDAALVARSRYIVDYRPSALAAAAELAVAKEAGLVDDTHIAGEIGEVLLGRVAGRAGVEDVTLYKSLGHVVQDLAAVAYLHRRADPQRNSE